MKSKKLPKFVQKARRAQSFYKTWTPRTRLSPFLTSLSKSESQNSFWCRSIKTDIKRTKRKQKGKKYGKRDLWKWCTFFWWKNWEKICQFKNYFYFSYCEKLGVQTIQKMQNSSWILPSVFWCLHFALPGSVLLFMWRVRHS